MHKGLSPLISLILVAVISIASIVLVLRIGNPLLERIEETSTFSEAKDIMNQINSAVKEVSYEGNGSSRKLNILVKGGEYRVLPDEDSIVYQMESRYELFSKGMWKSEGDLVISTGADVSAYEADVTGDGKDELVLENSYVLFAVNKTGNETDPEPLNTKYLIKKLRIKDSNYNVTPTDSSIKVIDLPDSSLGTGYTKLLGTGSHLNEGRIKLSMTTDSGESYQITYTLGAKSDFVRASVSFDEEEKNSSVFNAIEYEFYYQEDADETTCTGEPCDGNWNTCLTQYHYSNYTKPSGVMGAIWQTKDGNGIRNITIPQDCWDYDSNKIILQAWGNEEDSNHYYCYNGTEFKEIGYYAGYNNLCEEAIWWNLMIFETNVNTTVENGKLKIINGETGYAISYAIHSYNVTKATISAEDTKNFTNSYNDTFSDYSGLSDFTNVTVENEYLRLSNASWERDWDYRKNITIEEEDGVNRTIKPVEVNVSDIKLNTSNCTKEIRIENSNGNEIPYQIIDGSGESLSYGSQWCVVAFLADVQPNSNATYMVYYGNSSASAPDYSSSTDLSVSESSGTLTAQTGYYYFRLLSNGLYSDEWYDKTAGSAEDIMRVTNNQWGTPRHLYTNVGGANDTEPYVNNYITGSYSCNLTKGSIKTVYNCSISNYNVAGMTVNNTKTFLFWANQSYFEYKNELWCNQTPCNGTLLTAHLDWPSDCNNYRVYNGTQDSSSQLDVKNDPSEGLVCHWIHCREQYACQWVSSSYSGDLHWMRVWNEWDADDQRIGYSKHIHTKWTSSTNKVEARAAWWIEYKSSQPTLTDWQSDVDPQYKEYSKNLTITLESEEQKTEGYHPSGYAKSVSLPSDNLIKWNKFYANHDITADGTNISYRILNSSDDSILCTISSSEASSGYDISSCAGTGPIKLYSNLSTSNVSNTPVLYDWNVSWNETMGNVTYYLSADNGLNWEEVSNGQEHVFTKTGKDLKVKIFLNKTGQSPFVENYTLNYTYTVCPLPVTHNLNYSLSANSNLNYSERWVCTEDLDNDLFLAWVFAGDEPNYTNYTQAGNSYRINITSQYDVLLAFSKERCSNVEGKENSISSGSFWDMQFPAFSYETVKYVINIILNCAKINIVNDERWSKGYYNLVIKNEGYSEGKTNIRINIAT